MEEENVKKTSKKNLIIGIIIAVVVIAIIVAIIIAVVLGTKGGKKAMVGTYKIVEMSEGDETYTSEQLAALSAFGFTIKLEIREDGTGTLEMSGEKEDITYNDKEFIAKDGENEEAIPYTFKDNRITLERDEGKMVFEKADN